MSDKFGQDDGKLEEVDMSMVPKRSGLTLYGSTKIEQYAGGHRAQCYGNCTYNAPIGMSARKALDVWTQMHQEAVTRAWHRAQERLIAIERGNEDSLEQFEVDQITGEILQ